VAISPQADSEGPVRVTVRSGGRAIVNGAALVSVQVRRAVGAVPTARLVLNDGDMPSNKFPTADGEEFIPGAEISIDAGYGEKEDRIFEGVVVRHGLRITGDAQSRLVVECRDKAVRMTVGRRNDRFVEQTDHEIIQTLVSRYSLDASIDSTSVTHPELVQYYCTDWDFVIARAEANGLLVIVEDGKVKVCAPPAGGSPALKVTYGADLVEFQADVDARSQLKSVETAAWDPKSQTLITETSSPAALHEQGNLESGQLARVIDLAQYRLQTATPLDHASLAAWGQAQQVKAGLARVRGRMKFQGSAAARVGELIEVAGVGARYNGHAFVGAVEHEIVDGSWFTVAELGLAPDWFCERPDVGAPAAAGWLPGAEGLQIGVVVALDGDPAGEQRVQIKLPVLGGAAGADTAPRVWARLAQLHASGGFGGFFVPEVGDEVVVGFFNHDPTHPVVLGSMYSSGRKPAYPLAADNDIKAIVTRCLSRIEFNEKDKIITVMTPAQNRVVFSDKDQSVLLQDQNGNKVELNPQGITINTPKDLKITVQGTITIDAVGAISITSTADVKSHGLNVACEADVGFSAKGSATAELSAAGQTTVKGAMVMIN